MRWTPLLLLLGALALGAAGSPVSAPATRDDGAPAAPQPDPGRRAAESPGAGQARQAAAPAASDDDDDDDDDDDVDLDLEDDDDDDDEDDDDEDTADDDDDDDEDYFERFFDDILGDDDDEEDDSPSVAAVLPVAAAPVAAAPVPVAAAADQAQAQAATSPAAVRPGSALPDDIDPADYDQSPAYDEGEPAAEEQAANTPVTIDLTSAPDQGLKDKPQAAPAPAPTPAAVVAAAPAAASSTADDDDDDDDDEDDFDVDLTDDDDEDEDEDEDEDDDDDDDDDEDDLEDVVGDTDIDAKRSQRSRAMTAGKPGAVPPVYISKYNRFVDNVLGRINRVLKKNYDPVNVRLHPPSDSKNNNKNSNKNKKKGNKKKTGGIKSREGETPAPATNGSAVAAMQRNATEALAAAVAAVSEQLAGAQRPSQRLVPVHTVQKRGRANKNNDNNKNKKRTSNRTRPGAKATLYGLSSLKRDGDVTVNMMSSHNTIKTKFTIGPLMLKVEKEFGRGAKKDIRSATATTTEMSGRMNLRVVHGGAATLHSIRVMQPRQVRVESMDDHDKTREYIWRRSSNIARVVSQKLTNATRSMLQPPPVTTNFMSAIFS
ncbi:clumping factor A-like [Bacillus rossius redtenbacheri]|uniref:clumping factor A-like n=1 Tax=Bacillus rossius redtenbacheri TaxID=93214 RepID=UPI002FDCD5FE